MIRETLKKIYEDITQGPSRIDLFLCKSQRQIPKYKKKWCIFLKSEGLSNNKKKSQNHTINKPIMSSSPNEIWDWLHKYGQLCSANGGIEEEIHSYCCRLF
jgi:hypothetical protein